jgi:hypothetical protein
MSRSSALEVRITTGMRLVSSCGLDLPQHLDAVDLRHLEIEQQELGQPAGRWA